MLNFNFAVIFRDSPPASHLPQLSFKPIITMKSWQGWTAILGWFNESDIEGYEHYPASQNWETLIGWEDLPL